MKSNQTNCSIDEQNQIDLQNKLKSCRLEVSRLEQYARDIIEKDIHASSILDTAVDGIITISKQGVIQSFNTAAEKIFGYNQDQVIGQKVNMLMPEPHRSRHDQYIQSYLHTGRRKIIGIGRETMARRSDGSTFPIELSVSEINTEGERIFSGIIRDITARRKSAADLKASEDRFRILVETMNDGLAVQDAEGKIIYVNPRFCSILGYDQQCLLGTKVAELMDTASQIVLQNELNEKQNQDAGMVELKMEKDDGELLHVRVSAKAIRSPNGDIKGSFVVITDVTQIKKLQHQLFQAQKMEAIGRLAGGVAHDFNNLLTVILGYVDLSLLDLDENDPLYRNISQIDEAAQRAGSLTRQLLAFSRKQMLQPKIIELNKIVSNLDDMLHRLIGEDVILNTVMDADAGFIRADKGQIEQVIVNIVVNARDAMPGGGNLTLETRNVRLNAAHLGIESELPPGSYAQLAITDSGTGMDPEIQARIFEPFFTTKEKGQGTGLGLSTAFGIIKQSGGEIMVYSELGKGTCFKIYLPMVAGVESQPESESSSAPICGNETILVVEDEDAVRNLVVDALSRCGYHVLEAPDGPTAIERYANAKSPIDLILTDVIMPKMNGKQLVARLKPLYPDAKILYMSGYTDDAIVHHGVLAPGTPFIHKPFTMDNLTRRIRKVLLQP